MKVKGNYDEITLGLTLETSIEK